MYFKYNVAKLKCEPEKKRTFFGHHLKKNAKAVRKSQAGLWKGTLITMRKKKFQNALGGKKIQKEILVNPSNLDSCFSKTFFRKFYAKKRYIFTILYLSLNPFPCSGSLNPHRISLVHQWYQAKKIFNFVSANLKSFIM